jgi:hypothetical protein
VRYHTSLRKRPSLPRDFHLFIQPHECMHILMSSDPDKRPPEQLDRWLKGKAPAHVLNLLDARDGGYRLVEALTAEYPPGVIATKEGNEVWEQIGCYYLLTSRPHLALPVFFALYDQMLKAQKPGGRVHKGMVLCWLSDCFRDLGYILHAKRYLMLTLCEDALTGKGIVPPETTGVYFRLVWQRGLPDAELKRYAVEFARLEKETPQLAHYPEALLQLVDDRWLTEIPSANEVAAYRINQVYARHLFDQLGQGSGRSLELLAHYLLSCMPGCRATRRVRTPSTDYDVVCAMEGFEVDFRSEFGRYFVCECKDWSAPADFTTMAKFCRVLDSTKARFGVLFSSEGISGAKDTKHAAREQLKIFQDRGVVIVVLDKADLEQVIGGVNLTQLLRKRYEEVRLDLRPEAREPVV